MRPGANFISQSIHFLSAWVILFRQPTQKRAAAANSTRTEIQNFIGIRPVGNFWTMGYGHWVGPLLDDISAKKFILSTGN